MRTFPVCRHALAVVFLAAALSSASAAPAPPDKDAAAAAPNPREGLDRIVTLQIDKQTLSAAVAQLRDKTKLNIVLDAPAVAAQLGGAPEGTPVNVQTELKDVKVRTALRTLLDPYDLTFVVLGDSILITTEDAAAARQMSQRVSVHFDKVELAAALKQLARENGVNLPLDPRAEKEASAKVSLDVEDVSLETAVRLLADMAGLKPARAGNTLFVTKKDVAAVMRAEAQSDAPRRKVYLDRDYDISVNNALIWQMQGRAVRQVIWTPVLAPNPPPVKQVDESTPANPDSPPPEKKDGDK